MSRPALILAALLLAGPFDLAAETETPPAVDPNPNYLLSAGDTVMISIYNEPDLTIMQTLARSGEVRLPLIGEIIVANLSVRDAEHEVEKAYREREILRKPTASLTVTAYFPREVSVLGAVRNPGTVVFPRDVTTLDLVEVITRVGGFLPVSKSDAVTVTHRGDDGVETVTTFDLENTISGRRSAGRPRADVAIYPGDRIWVPERLF